MDESTSQMDMESIALLNTAPNEYKDTLILISHDREFVSSPANRTIKLAPHRGSDFHGTHEEYMRNRDFLRIRSEP